MEVPLVTGCNNIRHKLLLQYKRGGGLCNRSDFRKRAEFALFAASEVDMSTGAAPMAPHVGDLFYSIVEAVRERRIGFSKTM